MFLTDNLWKIFEVAREERTDGDNFEGDMSVAPDLFINAIKGNEDFACMADVDKDALLAEWEAEDQAAAQAEYNMIVHGQGGNNDFCRYKELCDAYHAGDRAKFQAIVDEALAAYHSHD